MLWAPWQLSGTVLAEGQRDAIELALREQEQAGLDVVTDGEQSRQHVIGNTASVQSASIRTHVPVAREARVPPELLRLLSGKDVVVGAIDIATDVVETPAQVQATLRRALEHVPVQHLCASTNCGLALLPRGVARRKLQALVAGTAQLRRELGG